MLDVILRRGNINIVELTENLIRGENNFIANAANFSSLLYFNLENLNWCGFYFSTGKELLLGPFCGKPACIRIPFDKGVCGAAFSERRVFNIADVHDFPGHIACDEASNSELVVPILYENKIYGVLDVDGPIKNRFSETDAENIKSALNILIRNSDIKKVEEFYRE